jgi:HSP20 family protein
MSFGKAERVTNATNRPVSFSMRGGCISPLSIMNLNKGGGAMKIPSLWTGQDLVADPFKSFRREMEDLFRNFGQNLPALNVGAGAPAINVAETDGALEVTAELPGVEEKDIKVSVDGNRLGISGEKKHEEKRDEKDWHVEERSFGSFYRSMTLPFSPADGAISAHLDKGVLHVAVKKPVEAAKSAKAIEIKTGAPPQAG